MSLPRLLRSAAILAVAAGSAAVLPAASLTGQRPNIVFILTDDQGYATSPRTDTPSSKRRTSTASTARARASRISM